VVDALVAQKTQKIAILPVEKKIQRKITQNRAKIKKILRGKKKEKINKITTSKEVL
jgi:hypothetical protein